MSFVESMLSSLYSPGNFKILTPRKKNGRDYSQPTTIVAPKSAFYKLK
jgi:hypothetical protein